MVVFLGFKLLSTYHMQTTPGQLGPVSSHVAQVSCKCIPVWILARLMIGLPFRTTWLLIFPYGPCFRPKGIKSLNSCQYIPNKVILK